MNERLKELARQAGFMIGYNADAQLERFAELVRQDERNSSKTIDVTDLVLRAKAEEREACAKLCDEWFAGTAGVDIRARGVK
jgi:hypothetical protein